MKEVSECTALKEENRLDEPNSGIVHIGQM
jgi:hypothetical protein